MLTNCLRLSGGCTDRHDFFGLFFPRSFFFFHFSLLILHPYHASHSSALHSNLHGMCSKRRKIRLSDLDFLDGDEEIEPKVGASRTGKQGIRKIKFKRIKKEDARRIKEEVQSEDVKNVLGVSGEPEREEDLEISIGTKKKSVSGGNENDEHVQGAQTGRSILDELGEKERLQGRRNGSVGSSRDERPRQSLERRQNERETQRNGKNEQHSLESDPGVDRDWYTQDEELGHRYMDEFDAEEQEQMPLVRKMRPQSRIRHFDDGEDEVDPDINLVVHRLTPPFLDAKAVLSDGAGVRDVVRDRTGDLYRVAREGSGIVAENRREQERSRNARDVVDGKGRGEVGGGEEVAGKVKKGRQSRKVEKAEKVIEDKETHRRKIQQERRRLPAYKIKEQFLRAVHDNQVLVVVGETGSGKSTQLPQFLRDAGYSRAGMIGITQPRRVAAITVSSRVSDEMGVELGREVGYAIRFEDNTCPQTQVKFMTDGILLREFLQDADLDRYSCIIMDEAHERSLSTDILLGLLRGVLSRRRDLKLIVTSATMNAGRFCSFFGHAEQFVIPGRTYPVDIEFLKVPPLDYVESAVRQAIRVHVGAQGPGDILVFMTGQEDIGVTCREIEKRLRELSQVDNTLAPLDVLPIFSMLATASQARIFDASPRRKCIVATNIAETSLTVPGVRYVVDSGLVKVKVYNPRLGIDVLQTVPISRAQADQRAGRAGRTAPGKCFRMYTYGEMAAEMFAEPIPEIQRTNLDSTVLVLKSLNVTSIDKFPLLDRPSAEALATAQYDLWAQGALGNEGGLTALGARMCRLPLPPALAKLLVLSTLHHFHCVAECLTLVAMLTIPAVFLRPRGDSRLQNRSDRARERFLALQSDHLTLVNVYEQFEAHGRDPVWCQHNFLQYRSLRRARDVRNQLESILRASGYNTRESAAGDPDLVRECVCAAYFQHAAVFKKYGSYQNLRSGMEVALAPTSALFGMGDLPRYVVYHEVVLTGKMQHMNCATAVDGLWLARYGSVFYAERNPAESGIQHQKRVEAEFARVIHTAE